MSTLSPSTMEESTAVWSIVPLTLVCFLVKYFCVIFIPSFFVFPSLSAIKRPWIGQTVPGKSRDVVKEDS